jgi:phage terminase Nu1 subunit (DNA packaging protein)
MSLADYARHRGVSTAAVTYAIRDGRISVTEVNGKRMIESDRADLEWNENTVHEKKRHTPEGATAKIIAPKTKRAPPPPPEPDSAETTETYAKSRAQKEHYQAKLAKLDYEKRAGTLVDAHEVQLEAYKIARAVRDALLSIPDRVASELAAETNAFKLHARLTDELRKTLVSLKEILDVDPEGQ